MKIKILDDFVHEYEDVTQGEVYEVVEVHPYYYIISDDKFEDNTVLKERCEIVAEEVMFKKGDRVTFNNEYYSWFGNEYIVTDIAEGNAVHVIDNRGKEFSFHAGNLKVINTDTLQRIQDFTRKHKNLEVSFNDGKMILRDFTPSFEPDEYHCVAIEQLEELMGAWEGVSKFKVIKGVENGTHC